MNVCRERGKCKAWQSSFLSGLWSTFFVQRTVGLLRVQVSAGHNCLCDKRGPVKPVSTYQICLKAPVKAGGAPIWSGAPVRVLKTSRTAESTNVYAGHNCLCDKWGPVKHVSTCQICLKAPLKAGGATFWSVTPVRVKKTSRTAESTELLQNVASHNVNVTWRNCY